MFLRLPKTEQEKINMVVKALNRVPEEKLDCITWLALGMTLNDQYVYHGGEDQKD